MALLLGSLRKAKKPGERAEDEVLHALDRELPSHWIVIGLIPPKRLSGGGKRYSCKEIDAVVVGDRLIFVVEIKSHRGVIRVRAGRPFQLDGFDIMDSGNRDAGFWDNHQKQCYQLKQILNLRLGVQKNCIIPKFIWAGTPQFDFGSSNLDEHVTDCATFVRIAVAEDSGSQCIPLTQAQATALAQFLADEDQFTAPGRHSSKPSTKARPQATTSHQGQIPRAAYSPSAASISTRAAHTRFITTPDGITTIAPASVADEQLESVPIASPYMPDGTPLTPPPPAPPRAVPPSPEQTAQRVSDYVQLFIYGVMVLWVTSTPRVYGFPEGPIYVLAQIFGVVGAPYAIFLLLRRLVKDLATRRPSEPEAEPPSQQLHALLSRLPSAFLFGAVAAGLIAIPASFVSQGATSVLGWGAFLLVFVLVLSARD